MSTWPAAAELEDVAAAERRKRARAVAARARVNPLRNGVATIVVVGALLAGLVAVNVAVLQLNVRLDKLSRERADLKEQNAELASQFSTAKASPLIQERAARMGLVPADPARITYVELSGK
jgi:hypothetical protein